MKTINTISSYNTLDSTDLENIHGGRNKLAYNIGKGLRQALNIFSEAAPIIMHYVK
ncbi:ComC/BlpC family leader-containing pheromone/bacteriocin [Lactobacillus sp. ESL0684]|uniref:ComC/BlpC family leader-containing pheromone/bacteriocin n=1 Tax=Lactobacillus sp. ESL0684 TaxID=2983213 RepID=UPI0023F6B100|nr:ComC/BlpC family leader-containing pheromone/bacteriocin [Lactobacillus sp. ESL0684]WEV43229.1 ComC/BlpC family leader-containing pheromone/bacteriocin [Lactobacillus sp. ESL0684]